MTVRVEMPLGIDGPRQPSVEAGTVMRSRRRLASPFGNLRSPKDIPETDQLARRNGSQILESRQ